MENIHYTESINYEIERTARTMKLLAGQLFSKLKIDIQTDEYCALDIISCNNDICQRDLAKYLLKDRANTGRIVNSLEKKDLIIRLNDIRNNRLIKKISISQNGKKKLSEVNYKLQEYLQTTVKPFPEEEIVKFHKTVQEFRKNLEKLLELNI